MRQAQTGTWTVVATALCATSAVEGAFIYAAGYREGVHRVDVDTGAVERVSDYRNAWALAGGADADHLFIARSNGRLTSLDLTTGATQEIGGRWTTNSLAMATDGFLYSGSWRNGDLRRIDPLTGAATVVGRGSVRGYAGDLAAAPTGDLYGVSIDNEIVLTRVADGSTSVLFSIIGVEAWGIATTYDGRYWLSSASSLYELDMATGGLRFVTDLGFDAYDLASVPGMSFAATVPSPSASLALAGLGGCIAARRSLRR